MISRGVIHVVNHLEDDAEYQSGYGCYFDFDIILLQSHSIRYDTFWI